MFENKFTYETGPAFNVHKVISNEWEKLRDIRTRAIIDSPQAFGDTLEKTQARQEDEWRSWATGANVYAIEDNGKYIATVTLRKGSSSSEAVINGVWTDPDYRGKGLSTKLFNEVFIQAKKMNLEKLTLMVNVNQVAAYNSYLKLGFITKETLPNQLMGDGNRYDEFVMEKRL